MSQPYRAVRVFCSAACLTALVLARMTWGPFFAPPGLKAGEKDRSVIRTAAARTTEAPAPGPLPNDPYPIPTELMGVDLTKQTPEHAAAKSWGCVQCHQGVHEPHKRETVQLGCVDCHGGDPNATTRDAAHVLARFPDAWATAANPVRSYALLNHECPEFVRFVNPADLRVAHLSCGMSGCHGQETLQVKKSMMTHGCMLWGAALYNNGAVPNKASRYGESYSMNGTPQRLQTVPPPTADEMLHKGVLQYLDPLPQFQISQPANVLRIFERGGRFAAETGIPERLEEGGRPRARLSVRGLGTANRTDPVFIGLQKTRLLDPTLNFMGTNDHPGDYRSSGCTACHMVYANDRSVLHSGPFAKFGNRGLAGANPDPMISKEESGHPISHEFTKAIPTSQCIVCHVHPGTNVMNSYLGYLWWDEETDGEFMYPADEKNPTAEELIESQMSNPDEAAARGNWSDPEFLANSSELNSQLRHTQFADFHGHGWMFRAVFKKDRQGTLLDHHGEPIPEVSNAQLQQAIAIPLEVVKHEKLKQDARDNPADAELQKLVSEAAHSLDELRDNVPVHLLDIHLEKGMHCVDCHFVQDVHGNTKLYGEVRAAIEITCTDCHGTTQKTAALRTTGPAAEVRGEGLLSGRNLKAMRTPFGKPRFEHRGDQLIQNSLVEPELSWVVKQVRNTVDPEHADYNALSALAKTVRFKDASKQEMTWGDVPQQEEQCAHSMGSVSCIACHSSWNPSCFGCHLPQKANKKQPNLHFEGDVTKNFVSYNFQTLRDDVFMLARDGTVTGNRIGPARSSCAIHVGSYNGNRESIYVQQQTVSGDGLSGIAFSSNVPHTVRGRGETKQCSDCHVSEKEDNNAIVAQLLMQGTNYTNFIGRHCWVAAGEEGLFGVVVTERDEPQAVIGSSLHNLAFPSRYQKHVERNFELKTGREHPGLDIGEKLRKKFRHPEILSVQQRGEYLYAACGPNGLRVFDVAFIDNKAFSERITTAPVSPLGQKFFVRTKFATAVAAPTTIVPDPTRKQHPENQEQAIHPLYGYIYVADKEEGLILVGVGVTIDGNPTNNFLERALTFNPDGILCGAEGVTIVGNYAYVCCEAGLVVVCLDDPLHPVVTSVLGHEFLHKPKMVQVQFRYGFVCDEEGIKVIDTTHLSHPEAVKALLLEEAHSIYVARTYAYVAGGTHGLVILDVSNPTDPKIDQVYDAGGCINDLHDVKLGITYVSEFAYLADGKNGMRVVQLTSPETPGNDGFSPRPTPQLVATFPIPKGGHALAISEGVDRDRAVDESGNQIGVFGRVGARPLNLADQHKMYLRPDGSVWRVSEAIPDYSIAEPRLREKRLTEDLLQLYPSRNPFQSRRAPEQRVMRRAK